MDKTKETKALILILNKKEHEDSEEWNVAKNSFAKLARRKS
jgi:hypothetical protein